MRVRKRILSPGRLRQVPEAGFSWVDRRFVRDYARALSRDGVLLYFFLSAVSDRHGLSYYGDAAISRILGMSENAVYAARNELQHRDLILYEAPLYQVLAIPEAQKESSAHQDWVGEILTRLRVQEGRA